MEPRPPPGAGENSMTPRWSRSGVPFVMRYVLGGHGAILSERRYSSICDPITTVRSTGSEK